ncbi:MAG TPA: 30S ribosomal protein S20 [Chlamydiales bacterium]|nr:30S ribosomal protein S20 [Chlamydiales bacterium]
MANDKKEKEKQTKRPSALKRDLQSERRRLRNRSFRSSVSTAIRSLKDALSQKQEAPSIQEKLNTLYSMVDKGVKKGVFKPGKGARTKSRLSLLCTKA